MLSQIWTVLLFVGLVLGRPTASNQEKRQSTAATYDYIVVGCGASGLVVSTRLSENTDVTILCLEAGAL
jgi:choline dehydrogenase